MLEKLQHVSRIVFLVHICVGFSIVAALVWVSRIVIGVGQFDELVYHLETFNFKWWLVGIATALWLLPIVLVVIYRAAVRAGLEVDQLRATLRGILEDRALPIKVDIDTRIPVSFDEPLRVPIQLTTKIDFDEEMEIEGEIPFSTELPIDTDIQTKVLGLGTIRVPIRARLPVDVVVPVKGTMRIKASGVPIEINEVALVDLPPIEIPLRCRIETKIDVLTNLEAAERALRKGG